MLINTDLVSEEPDYKQSGNNYIKNIISVKRKIPIVSVKRSISQASASQLNSATQFNSNNSERDIPTISIKDYQEYSKDIKRPIKAKPI